MKIHFILILIVTSAFALDLTQRRQAIINIIDEEISEVHRLSRQVKNRDPNLYLREAELNLEKARLIREAENQEYLSLSAETRRRAKKSNYFRKSKGYFANAQAICERLLKKFRRFSQKGDVYYIMAYNAKELGQNKTSKKYFKLSLKNSSKNSTTTVKSQIALADIYYNEKKYSQSVPLYRNSLKKHDDKWWTKDAFNLAWSYFRLKQYNSAISYMNEIYKKSKEEKYVDMSDAVERDIGLFYAQAGRTSEGLNFYQRAGKNFTEVLIGIASRLKADSNFAQAKTVLSEALKIESSDSKKVEIYSELMELYAQFGKTNALLYTCNKLNAYNKAGLLSSEHLERLKYHTQNQAAILQKQVASKTYARVYKTRKAKAKMAISFFELSYDLLPQKRAEIRFLQGETYYAIGWYESALKKYELAYNESKVLGDSKFKKLSLDALLATLGQKNLKKSVKDKYYVTIYRNYLETDNSSKKAQSIYKKLFNTHFDRNELDLSEAVLAEYRTQFPSDYKTQENMIARLMDYYRKKKNYAKVVFWIKEVQVGHYKTSAKYQAKVKDLLTNMQMKSVQNALASGQKVSALKGYLEVYNRSDSTANSRKNSAYNIAVLYYELSDIGKTYEWSLKALAEMNPQDVKKFEDSFLTFSTFFFDRRQFFISADLNSRMLGKLCRVSSRSKGVMFKNSVFVHLAEGELEKAKKILSIGSRCNVRSRYLTEAKIEILKELGAIQRWEEYEAFLSSLYKDESIRPDLIPYFHKLYKTYKKLGESKSAQEMKSKSLAIYNDAKKKKKNIPLESLDIIANYLFIDVINDAESLKNISLSFPEDKYNILLKQKLAILDKLTNSALRIHDTGSGKGIVRSYFIIINAYNDLASEVEKFTPPGKSVDYIKSFKANMEGIVTPLRKQASDYNKQALLQINKYDILSKDTFLFLKDNQPELFDYSYAPLANVMDRGGRR